MRSSQISKCAALLSVALLCASGQALAAESRPMEPDGISCPESANASSEAADDADADAIAAPARRTQKAKPAATSRASNGGGGNRSSAPRWHSFLPGMFR
jgi:septal ring-binding cell division protein DamX